MSAFSVENDNGIAILTLDLMGESVNKLSRSVREEFVSVFDIIERDPSIHGVVLLSGKADTFIAGADIEEFAQWSSATEAESASREGHRLLARIERSAKPVVAAIHGACLGGGLELALACGWRVATEHPKTVLALPEVQLGLIPGGGGTQRLPKVVGLQAALEIILTGKNVRARKAGQMGLVHELVHPAILRSIAVQRARDLAAGTRKRNANARSHTAKALLLDDNALGRSIVFRQARERTLTKTRGQYPAPLAALEAVAAGYQSAEAGYDMEARLFGELAASPECRELVFLFFATTALKKDSGTAHSVRPARIAKLGILGAGFMGAGIASVAVRSGIMVRLKDADLARVGHGMSAVYNVLREGVKRRQLTPQQMADAMLLAGGTADYSGFANVDCVIEAVFEDLQVKHAVLREVEAVLPPHAIFASNTSTIPIQRIAEASRRPERVLGMHFFSPVHKMPLLEVIVTRQTAPEVTASAVSFGKQLGKTVIVVNDAPGFYVNRILSPYLNEAGRLLDLGAPIEAIDSAMLAFGFPVGPITLLDEVGLDIAGKSGAIFHEAFGERMAPSVSLQRVVQAGRLGRKGKSGFYTYDAEGKKGDVDVSVYDHLPTGRVRSDIDSQDVQGRCVLAMVNEAVRCLEEGIVRSPRDGDVGAVFGFGFPPFRGGPFRYVDALGAGAVVTRLEELEGRYPGRFTPADLLVQHARRSERFYSR